MAECKHNFVYDELHRQIVCVKCGYVLTNEDKRKLHRHAFELMEEEENVRRFNSKAKGTSINSRRHNT